MYAIPWCIGAFRVDSIICITRAGEKQSKVFHCIEYGSDEVEDEHLYPCNLQLRSMRLGALGMVGNRSGHNDGGLDPHCVFELLEIVCRDIRMLERCYLVRRNCYGWRLAE